MPRVTETTIITPGLLTEEAAEVLEAVESQVEASVIQARAVKARTLLAMLPQGWRITRESAGGFARFIATPGSGLPIVMYADRVRQVDGQTVGWVGILGTYEQALAQMVVLGLAALDAEARS